MHADSLPGRAALLGPDTSLSSLDQSSGGSAACEQLVNGVPPGKVLDTRGSSSGDTASTDMPSASTSWGGGTSSDASDDRLAVQWSKLGLSQHAAIPAASATPTRPPLPRARLGTIKQEPEASPAVKIPTSLSPRAAVQHGSPIMLPAQHPADVQVVIPTSVGLVHANSSTLDVPGNTVDAPEVAAGTKVPDTLLAPWTDISSASASGWASSRSQAGTSTDSHITSLGNSADYASDDTEQADDTRVPGANQGAQAVEAVLTPRSQVGSAGRVATPTLMEVLHTELLEEELGSDTGSQLSSPRDEQEVYNTEPHPASHTPRDPRVQPPSHDPSRSPSTAPGVGSQADATDGEGDGSQADAADGEGDGSHAKLLQQLGQAFADLEQLVLKRLEVRKATSDLARATSKGSIHSRGSSIATTPTAIPSAALSNLDACMGDASGQLEVCQQFSPFGSHASFSSKTLDKHAHSPTAISQPDAEHSSPRKHAASSSAGASDSGQPRQPGVSMVPNVAYPTSSLGGGSHVTSDVPAAITSHGTSRAGNSPSPSRRLVAQSSLGRMSLSSGLTSRHSNSSNALAEGSGWMRSRHSSGLCMAIPLPPQQAPHPTRSLDPDDGLPEGLICTMPLTPEDSRDLICHARVSTVSVAPDRPPAQLHIGGASLGGGDAHPGRVLQPSSQPSVGSACVGSGAGDVVVGPAAVVASANCPILPAADCHLFAAVASSADAAAAGITNGDARHNIPLPPIPQTQHSAVETVVSDAQLIEPAAALAHDAHSAADAASVHEHASEHDTTSHHNTWGSASHTASSGGGSRATTSQQLHTSSAPSAPPSAQPSAATVLTEASQHVDSCSDTVHAPVNQTSWGAATPAATAALDKLLAKQVQVADTDTRDPTDTIPVVLDVPCGDFEQPSEGGVSAASNQSVCSTVQQDLSGCSTAGSSDTSQAGSVAAMPVVVEAAAVVVVPVALKPSCAAAASQTEPVPAAELHSNKAVHSTAVQATEHAHASDHSTHVIKPALSVSVGVQTAHVTEDAEVRRESSTPEPVNQHVGSSAPNISSRVSYVSKSTPEVWRPLCNSSTQYSPPRMIRAAVLAAYTTSSPAVSAASASASAASTWLSPGRQRHHTVAPDAAGATNIRPPPGYPRTLSFSVNNLPQTTTPRDICSQPATSTDHTQSAASVRTMSRITPAGGSAYRYHPASDGNSPFTNIHRMPHSRTVNVDRLLYAAAPPLPAALHASYDWGCKDNIRPPPGCHRPVSASWVPPSYRYDDTPPNRLPASAVAASLPQPRAPAPSTWVESHQDGAQHTVSPDGDPRSFFAALVQQDSGLGEVLGRPVTPQEEAELKNLQDLARMKQNLSPVDKMKLWHHAEHIVAARLGATASKMAGPGPDSPTQHSRHLGYAPSSHAAMSGPAAPRSAAPAAVSHHVGARQASPEKCLDEVLSRVHHALVPNTTMALAMDREWVNLRQACSPGRKEDSPRRWP